MTTWQTPSASNLEPDERARLTELQRALAERVTVSSAAPAVLSREGIEALTTVAGVDVSFDRGSPWLHAAAVLLAWPSLDTLEVATATMRASMPYVPGFLSFREVPVVAEAIARLQRDPQLVVVDGHGIAHPTHLGIASHLGVEIGLPTVGCAKKILRGRCDEPGKAPGDHTPLTLRGEQLGWGLRTRAGAGPVFVSPGHRVDLEASLEVVWRCCRGYKLPEPTRRAHLAANDARRQQSGSRRDGLGLT